MERKGFLPNAAESGLSGGISPHGSGDAGQEYRTMEDEMERKDHGMPERIPAEDARTGQGTAPLAVEESCERLTRYLECILRDAEQTRLDVDALSEPCRELGRAMLSFHNQAAELNAYSAELSKGNLSADIPESESCLYSGLKELHANLERLARQAGQVTRGDYSQRVSGLGELSQAFNVMTDRLKEREDQLREQVLRAQRRAEIIESYTEMLVELLDQRDEWLLVVDRETREIIHCNKKPQDDEADGSFCDTCRHRLSIRTQILEADIAERYKIWEIEGEENVCYRVISFPIEWKERPSCVHIVMDVTAEKMNARHLTDKIYHDIETGVRSRKFLDEFMGRALRERQNMTMCYLNLEGVGEINAAHGQKVGDAYIQNFVEIVRKHFRSGDTFARVQDDKFCLVLTGNVKHLIERKMEEILTVFQRDDDRIFGHRCNFQYSVVEIEGEENQLSLDELLKKAEALIRQKRKRDPFEFDTW